MPSVARSTATGATLVVVEHRVDVWLAPRRLASSCSRPRRRASPTATPDDVLATRGSALAAAGVWVPGHAARACRGRPTACAADARSRPRPAASRVGRDRAQCRQSASTSRSPAGEAARDHRAERLRQVDARAHARRAAAAAAGGGRRGDRARGRRPASDPLALARAAHRASARCSRTPSTSSSRRPCATSSRSGRGPCGARAGVARASTSCSSACASTALAPRQPVHALGRRAAPALGRDRARDRARACSCSTSRPSGRTPAPGRSSSPCSPSCSTTARALVA